jgi:hypothetical protein
MHTPETYDKAISTLDGLIGITHRETLARAGYVEPAGPVCDGFRACLLGSTWIAHGEVPYDDYGSLALLGVSESERHDFLLTRPGLRMAYDALNEVAREILLSEFSDRYKLDQDVLVYAGRGRRELYWESEAEELFEEATEEWDIADVRKRVVELAQEARRRVMARYVEEYGAAPLLAVEERVTA